MALMKRIVASLVFVLLVGVVTLPPAYGDERSTRLEGLFFVLKEAKTPEEAALAEMAIEKIWQRSDSATISLLEERSVTLEESGELDGALGLSDFVVELDPKKVSAWYRRATILKRSGELDRARDDLDRLLFLEPRHYLGLALMSQILSETGDEEGAFKYAGFALEINPHVHGLPFDAQEVRRRLSGLAL